MTATAYAKCGFFLLAILVVAMASQTPGVSQYSFEVNSFIRGFHFYLLQREPENICDKHAVAVVKTDSHTIVGHNYSFLWLFSPSLQRGYSKGLAEVTGERIHRGAGYGLEVPCIYRLYGPKSYVEHAKDKISKLQNDFLWPTSVQINVCVCMCVCILLYRTVCCHIYRKKYGAIFRIFQTSLRKLKFLRNYSAYNWGV